MNWLAFSIAAWVCLGLDLGLGAIAIGPAAAGVRPSLSIPLAVFVALHAPPSHARWAALAIGAAIDLLMQPLVRPGDLAEVRALGPHALGLLAATQLTLAARGVVISRNPLTLVVLAFATSLIMHAIAVAFLAFRSLYDDTLFPVDDEIIHRLLTSAYTCAVALPLSFVLFALLPFMGFTNPQGRRF